MNDTPPPFNAGPAPAPAAPQPKSSSGGKCCGIGCLLTLVAFVVLTVVAVFGIKSYLSNMAGKLAADEPIPIEKPVLNQQSIADAQLRFDAFGKAAKEEDGALIPLELTEDDINALLFFHPDFKDLSGKARVFLNDDTMTAVMSLDLDDYEIPFKFLEKATEGKYFNAEVDLVMDMVGGRPVLQADALTINGIKAPEWFMKEFRGENLLKDAGSNPELKKFFDQIEDFSVEDSKLKIIPKAGASDLPDTPAGTL